MLPVLLPEILPGVSYGGKPTLPEVKPWGQLERNPVNGIIAPGLFGLGITRHLIRAAGPTHPPHPFIIFVLKQFPLPGWG